MIKAIALFVSLTANLALLGLLLRGAPALPRESLGTVRSSPTAAAPTDSGGVSVTREPAAYYRRLLSLGLDERQARVLLLAALETVAMSSIPSPEDRYWQPRRTALAQYGLAVAAAHAEIRRALESVVGPAAATEPAFTKVYRPVDLQFGFLSSAEQIAVHEWRLRRQQTLAARPYSVRAMPLQTGIADGEAIVTDTGRSPAADLQSLARVVSAEAAFEVALRDSALAEQLRSSGAVLREAEFRDAYAALAALDSAPANLEADLAARRRLRAVLGAERFARVWAGRDPTFGWVERLGRELGLTGDEMLACYGVWLDSQERLMELAGLGDVGSERAIAAAQGIADDEQRALAAIIGDDAARVMITARAAQFAAEHAAWSRREVPGE